MQLTIGQMAKLNNVTEQTLRLYDKMGLLVPVSRDDENGYRFYDIKQSAQLDMIQYMKSLGMQLKDIKEQLDNLYIPNIKNILRQKQRQIEEETEKLKYQKRAVERTIESLERYESAPKDGTILLEYIGSRTMYYIDSKVNIYDYDIDTYEKILREFKESLIAVHLPQIYFCNAGTILRQENLIQSRFISTEVFVFVDHDVLADELTSKIPANNYLCIYCDSFQKEKEYAKRLLEQIESKGYQINGDYLCEVITELPIISHDERGMYLRLQIPIKFC